MPKVTVRAVLACPAERVWRVVTDLERWEWRSDLEQLRAAPDGRSFVEYDWDNRPAYCRVSAYAPCRWYAVDVVSEKTVGRWDWLFLRDGAGTRVELTAEVRAKNALLDLLALAELRRKQRKYMEDLRLELEVD